MNAPGPKGKASSSKASQATTRKAEAPKSKARAEAPASERPGDGALERGDIFFFYRPDAEDEAPAGLLDVRRFHVLLRPAGRDEVRMTTVGRKMLPGSGPGGGNHWAFVDRVFADPAEMKADLAPARPAGEGVYALVRHAQGTVLAYALELPEEPGEVQAAFHIGREGRFVVSMKNPEAESPAGLGLDADRRVEFPAELMARFGSRKWLPADPPEFLDHEGAELILIGGRVAPDDDLGVELAPEPEDEDNAEVFRDLHLDRTDRTIRPLFQGEWA